MLVFTFFLELTRIYGLLRYTYTQNNLRNVLALLNINVMYK